MAGTTSTLVSLGEILLDGRRSSGDPAEMRCHLGTAARYYYFTYVAWEGCSQVLAVRRGVGRCALAARVRRVVYFFVYFLPCCV